MIDVYFNNTITERDMDMLLAETTASDRDFCRLLVDKTDLKGRDYSVQKIEISKVDSSLGESDVTIVLDVEGKLYGLLIEDKIDAIAMPNQHARYVKRGNLGVKKGEYSDFRIFIFCPQKYYDNNTEAKLYEHHISYEECREYFDRKGDSSSIFKSQQLEQAISKAKKPPVTNVNEKANAFLRKYIEYQRVHYPSLDLSTKEDKNGWWTDFRTDLGYVYIHHKIQEGKVDLTFPRSADRIDRLKVIADWARSHRIRDAVVVKTAKSGMIRINVPPIDMLSGFESVDKDELDTCFEAIKELTEFANMLELANSITLR